MAPLKIRQNHSFTPSPPRPPKGPYTPPIRVKAHISAGVFGELFAGTVGIFVLAVLFWKIGKYVRSFNRHRVLKEGNFTTTRYAKTWYGWIPIEKHQRNKRIIANAFRWILDWLSWESSRMDYNWVWWDPGQKTTQERKRKRQTPSWIPRFLRMYEPHPADQIWNPGSPFECHGALIHTPRPSVKQTTEPLTESSMISLNQPPWGPPLHISEGSGSSIYQECFTPLEQMSTGHGGDHNPEWQTCDVTETNISPAPFHQVPSPLMHSHYTIPSQKLKSQSAPNLSVVPLRPKVVSKKPGNLHLNQHRVTPNVQRLPRHLKPNMVRKNPGRHSQLRKCRAWSARMQLNTKKPVFWESRDSSGPPGTPFVDMLSTLLSEQAALDSLSLEQGDLNDEKQHRTLLGWSTTLFDQYCLPNENTSSDAIVKFHTLPARVGRRMSNISAETPIPSSPFKCKRLTSETLGRWSSRSDAQSSSKKRMQSLPQRSLEGHDDELCDWELRLIDGLNRRLVWIFNETTPGQKPYHFAQLANHWLNKETWLVVDPVSRVPIDCRREWGDPRFNTPYPEPTYLPKPKYPTNIQKRAYTPRIHSWRAAVNRQRRSLGLRDVVRTVELYENSVEEPPDGHIDPGSWMFPRPPQGFEVSTKQKNAWYESGNGWQETFDDWQRVRRGYRLRKIFQEGHVNRNWVKGLGSRAYQCCRPTSVKALPKDVQQGLAANFAVL